MENADKKELNNNNAGGIAQINAIEIKDEIEISKFGVRHVQMILLFLGLLFFHTLRVNISIAIVAMLDPNSMDNEDYTFDWDYATQTTISSSFFWGYVCGQIPSGLLSEKFGPRILLLIMMTICGILNILTPIGAVIGGWETLCALRVLQGLSQSFLFPCAHTMLSKWAPMNERARISAFVYAGGPLGIVCMYAISGVLATSPMGWPSIFYVSGSAGLLWALLWFFFGSNSPSENKYISQIEKDYIENSKGTSTILRLDIKRIPWKSIFTSLPFLSLIMAHVCNNWGYVVLLTQMPTYMNNVLGLDIQQNALFTALPYFVTWISSLTFSLISDYLMNKKILNTANSRKLYNSIGAYGSMIMLIALGYMTQDDVPLAITLLTVAGFLYGAVYVGYLLNHMDLAPNLAGILMGITNCSAAVIAIIAPLVSSAVMDDEKDPTQWRIVFYISGFVFFFGNTLFIIFGKGEIQAWNNI